MTVVFRDLGVKLWKGLEKKLITKILSSKELDVNKHTIDLDFLFSEF